MDKGKLHIVATPIGNLEDITFRAVRTLKAVNFIACEDTRVTKTLLEKFEFSKELFSLNAQSEKGKLHFVIDRILKGENCALVSDAGTPTISDPGVRLVNEAIKNEIEIIGIPGANAAILALSISGLPTDSFIYEGFLPQKKGRQKILKQLSEEERTIVLYESTYRIEKLLKELSEFMPDRIVVVQRELTKMFEESWRGYPNDILTSLPEKTVKGEFVVIISPLSWKE
jgi:16S rRNA (cytidine1402-2'-O)-methyltransferase